MLVETEQHSASRSAFDVLKNVIALFGAVVVVRTLLPTPPSAPDVTEIRSFLRDRVVEACNADYKENMDTWRGLETKAQGTAAIGTVFIGAMFTLTKDMAGTAREAELALLTLALFFVVVSIVLCVRALWIVGAPPPPVGKYSDKQSMDDMLWDHINLTDDVRLNEVFLGFMGDYWRAWNRVNRRLRALIEEKAHFVRWAQRCMIPAVLAVVILTLMRLFSQPQPLLLAP